MTESNLFREIEEDLQRQKMEELWKRYGVYVLGIALAIVLATALYNFMDYRRTRAEQEASAGLLEIINTKDMDKTKQIAALEAFANANPAISHAVFAQLEAASIAVKNGETDKAVEIYDALAKNEKAERIFRQFADLMAVQTQMDKGDPVALQTRLQPLLTDSPWRFIAKEYTAHLAIKAGDRDKAKQLFAELEQDTSTPAAIGQRSRDMAQFLNEGL